MRVILCGGRTYNNYPKVKRALDDLDCQGKGITVLVSGACPTGADRLARVWVEEKGYTKGPPARPRVWELIGKGKFYYEFPALWGSYPGGSAGPIRNKEMLEETNPDLVLAFPGGKGTRSTKKLARAANVKVLEVK